MTDIVFSFDTEDLANIAALDGILRCAEILRKHHVRGCFQVVGRLAELLEQEGRTDIIEALKYHEIDDHTLMHSLHPTTNELTDLEDYEKAHDLLTDRQRESHDILRRIFGVEKIFSFCPPGFSVSYVSHYVAAELGQPVYCGGIVYDRICRRPTFYCNMLSTSYDRCLESTLYERDKNMVALRVRREEELKEIYEDIAENHVLEVTYHHPSMALCTEWWDVVNCVGENPEDGVMKPSKHNTPELVEEFYARFDWLVGYIKKNPKFRITTYEELAKQYPAAGRVITRKDIPELKEQLEEKFFPVTLPRSLCISDIYHACRAFLQGKETHECGVVYGFLEEPFAIKTPVTVTRAEMEESAKRLPSYGWLPRSIIVGSSILGTADWLRAALAVLSGQDSVTVHPGDWQIDLNQFPRLRDICFNPCDWPIETPESLQDLVLTKRAKLQSWTIRLPQGTQRTVLD